MRNASAALISLLNTNSQFAVADCLTIVQQNGTITRLTNGNVPVTVESQYDTASHTFLPTFPFRRGPTKLITGTEVDNLSVTLMPDPIADLLGGVPWPAAARAGALDNAEVLLEKAIMATYGVTTPGTLILFWGRVGAPTFDRGSIALDVKADLVFLRNQMPRNIYQPGCLHTLFDSGCALVQATYTQSGAAQGGTTAQAIALNVIEANGYFDLGAITFTSGPNAGLTRVIRTHAGNVANLIVAFPYTPAVGNTFTIIPGCDKTLTTCDTKFVNLVHFRGFPVIPSAESAR